MKRLARITLLCLLALLTLASCAAPTPPDPRTAPKTHTVYVEGKSFTGELLAVYRSNGEEEWYSYVKRHRSPISENHLMTCKVDAKTGKLQSATCRIRETPAECTAEERLAIALDFVKRNVDASRDWTAHYEVDPILYQDTVVGAKFSFHVCDEQGVYWTHSVSVNHRDALKVSYGVQRRKLTLSETERATLGTMATLAAQVQLEDVAAWPSPKVTVTTPYYESTDAGQQWSVDVTVTYAREVTEDGKQYTETKKFSFTFPVDAEARFAPPTP